MSVKLVVVALLAAAVIATSDADDSNNAKADVLSFKKCASTDNECSCDSTDIKKYPVGQCVTDGSEHWKVDSCGAKVLKKYSDDNTDCEDEFIGLSMGCTAITYHKAVCADNQVKLYAGCNSDQCEEGKGSEETGDSNGCPTPTTFALSDTTSCKKAGNKYYKLPNDMSTCPGDGKNTITFMQYTEKGCGGEGKSVEVPTTCTGAAFQKVTCDASSGVTIKGCSDQSCGSCQESLTLPLKKYTMNEEFGHLYVDSCPEAKDNAKIAIEVYADVKTFEIGCHDHTETTCGSDKRTAETTTAETTATETTTAETTATETTTAETTTAETTAETTKDSTTDSSNEDHNITTDSNDTNDNGIIAPAHTVGVLALALCLLACVY